MQAAILNRLERVSEEPTAHGLESARRAIEGRFLAAGEVLAQAIEGVGGLIQSLEGLAATLEPTTVATTTQQLRQAAGGLTALPERQATRRGLVEQMRACGHDLTGCISDMRRTLAYLQTYAINIKITAGGITAARSEFAVFTQEVQDRIERGRGELNAFDDSLATLCAELAAALTQEEDLAGNGLELIPAVSDGLTACAQEIVDHHGRIAAAAEHVSGLARQVQKKVAGVLAAMQIGDITRQRIEHVQQALEMTDAVEGLSADAHARLRRFIVRMLADQLVATGADFAQNVAKIGVNMAGLAEDATEILRLRDLAFGRGGPDGGSFLGRMEAYVSQALEIVERLTHSDAAALKLGQSAASAATELTAKVVNLQSIKTDVQQMALNATLKCSRIGDPGKPLAVIAVELRLHAGHMETSSHEALGALEAMVGEASRLAQAGSGAEDVTAAAGAALSEACAKLSSIGAAVETDLVGLARQGEAVVESLRRAETGLDFEREIGAIIQSQAAALTDLAGEDAPWIDDIREPLTRLLAEIGKRYTMVSEREVQRRYVEPWNLEARPEAAEPAPADDDVLF